MDTNESSHILLPLNARIMELWRYRGIVSIMVKHQSAVLYLHSLLINIWSVLNPLAMFSIYTELKYAVTHLTKVIKKLAGCDRICHIQRA